MLENIEDVVDDRRVLQDLQVLAERSAEFSVMEGVFRMSFPLETAMQASQVDCAVTICQDGRRCRVWELVGRVAERYCSRYVHSVQAKYVNTRMFELVQRQMSRVLIHRPTETQKTWTVRFRVQFLFINIVSDPSLKRISVKNCW